MPPAALRFTPLALLQDAEELQCAWRQGALCQERKGDTAGQGENPYLPQKSLRCYIPHILIEPDPTLTHQTCFA